MSHTNSSYFHWRVSSRVRLYSARIELTLTPQILSSFLSRMARKKWLTNSSQALTGGSLHGSYSAKSRNSIIESHTIVELILYISSKETTSLGLFMRQHRNMWSWVPLDHESLEIYFPAMTHVMMNMWFPWLSMPLPNGVTLRPWIVSAPLLPSTSSPLRMIKSRSLRRVLAMSHKWGSFMPLNKRTLES